MFVTKPDFLSAVILPKSVKDQYLESYQQLMAQLPDTQIPIDYNASDPHNTAMIVKEQVQMCVNILSQPAPENAENLRRQMVDHCQKWDQVYGYNAREMYPELTEVWNQHGY